jgi:hypothetical protein
MVALVGVFGDTIQVALLALKGRKVMMGYSGACEAGHDHLCREVSHYI